ncbi:MAG: VIT1/CCC1 transporter family protein, partial [Candidatus Micrarchaeota archaeon]|nr:VIT1/CCC1 transporter family protein [Candidatus Micrarchaeota archaeon]
MDPREEGYIRTLYATEVLHKKVYAHFAEGESEPRLRQVLKRLSDIEQGHADSWSGLLGKGAHLPSGAYIGFQASLVYLLRRVLGLALAVKIIEYREQIVYNELNRRLEQMGDRKHAKSMSDMEVAMEGEEESLKRKVIEHSPVLNNIRDVILGANDGLVEILAATAGLGIVLRNPTLVLLSGLIVAVAGTLSMAGGVYLS